MSTKRQTTMAKLARERRVQERRELKREKKAAAAAERLARANGDLPPADADADADADAVDEEPSAASGS
jgi:hypothetical protein